MKTKKKKVNRHCLLVVTTSYPLTEDGISGIFVKRLNETLSAFYDFQVVCPSTQYKPEVNVKEIRYAPRAWQVLAQHPGGIPVALKTNRFAVLLVPSLLVSAFINVLFRLRNSEFLISHWSLSGMIAGFANIMFRRRSVVVFHGSDTVNLSSATMKRLTAYLAIRLNSFSVAVSEEIANNLKKTFPSLSYKIKFVSNGVSSDFLNLTPLKECQIIRCITIANLNPLKGVADIVHALNRLDDKSVQLTIVGDGPSLAALESLVGQFELQDRVEFIGEVSPGRLPQMMSDHQVFLLASYREGRPSVLLEAMASARAIVSTNLPGVTELIVNDVNGLLFEPGDIQKLSAQLASLVNDQGLMRNIGNAARDTIVDRKLSWEETALQYKSLLESDDD